MLKHAYMGIVFWKGDILIVPSVVDIWCLFSLGDISLISAYGLSKELSCTKWVLYTAAVDKCISTLYIYDEKWTLP